MFIYWTLSFYLIIGLAFLYRLLCVYFGFWCQESDSHCTHYNEIGDLYCHTRSNRILFVVSHFLIMIKHCLTLYRVAKIATKPNEFAENIYICDLFISTSKSHKIDKLMDDFDVLSCCFFIFSLNLSFGFKNDFSKFYRLLFFVAMETVTITQTSFTIAIT